jgi:NAD(P)-dependent dehydrogenase (short-subunit alcohol dehydrogenase family)
MGSLKDKIVIITGASSGIGARMAERFVAEGAQVIAAARRQAEGEALANRLGPSLTFVRADISREDEGEAMIGRTIDRFGRLDCLINNAGNPGVMNSIAETTVEHFDGIMAVHVRGAMLGMKHAARAMLGRKDGSIINIASIAGHRAGFSAHSYSAAKAALIHLTRSVAAELGEHGIRVNSISPGPILTGIFGKAGGGDAAQADREAEKVRAAFGQMLPTVQPMRRLGMPDDVAEMALFLASDAARLVNGQDIAVDGGITTGRPFSIGVADRTELARSLAS